MANSKEFQEGERAYEPRKTPHCPHKDGTIACSEWWKGFRSARLQKKESFNAQRYSIAHLCNLATSVYTMAGR